MSKLFRLNRNSDAETLRDWCLTIYGCIIKLDPGFSIMTDFFRSTTEKAYKERDLRTLREIYEETIVMVRETLTPTLLSSLNEILAAKFSYSIENVINEDISKIEIIIKHGHIRNDLEYELVKRREEEIYADESQRELMLKLQQLMLDYETPTQG